MKGPKTFDSDEATETVDEVEGHKKMGIGTVDADENDEVEGHRYQKQ